MSEILPPRDYQEECIADFFRRAEAGGTRIPHVLATGLGKTVIFAHIVKRWLGLNPGRRAMILVHTDELVQQAYAKIRQVSPHLTIGVVKAERNEVAAHVIVASVQSLRSAKRRAIIKRVGLIIVDECHHATAPTYRAILEHYENLPTRLPGESAREYQDAEDSRARVVVAGFTATLARGDKAKLSEVWESDSAPFTRGISFGIRRGYLLDVRGKRIIVPDMDLSKVRKQGGDYADGALAEELERSLAPQIIAEKYAELADGRKGLVFWPTVELAQHGAEAFVAAGVPSAVVHGGSPREERRLILKRLAAGEIRTVHNCSVLTEGFDDPTISCVVIARPTRSAPLYQQMVGRGLRPDLTLSSDARGDCLVLDVVGASRNHDLRSLVDLSEKQIPDDIALDEELSLLMMEEFEEERERKSQTPAEEEPYVGETEAIDFDPLGRTGIGAWLNTFGGTYFLPIGRRAYVLIVPSEDPGRWDVAWLPKDPKHYGHFDCPETRGYSARFTFSPYCRCPQAQRHEGSHGGLTEHRGLSLEMACSWAEEVMEKVGGKLALSVGGHAQSWRILPPNITLLRRAWELNVPTKGLNKGELSDALDILEASRRIDPVIGFMIASRED